MEKEDGGYYKDLGCYDGWNGKTVCIESALEKPLHWKKPRKIFVCSMGDLFHETVPFEFIDKVFAVMALCPQHTFQVLTKRAERMVEYFENLKQRVHEWDDGEGETEEYLITQMLDNSGNNYLEKACRNWLEMWNARHLGWPLPNVWLGVTAENQEMADKRIPLLLQTPAAKRFVSIEPMLGAIDLETNVLGCCRTGPCDLTMHTCNSSCELYEGIDLVICGGESGPGARAMRPDWVRSLRDQCEAAGVPFHFKSHGGTRKKQGHDLLDGVEHRPEFT
jgi:protein gp37